MRFVLSIVFLLVTVPMRASQESPINKPDGIYVSILPVEGRAMTGDNLIDVAVMLGDGGGPMRQYIGLARLEETFDIGLLDVAVLAESHGGELHATLSAVKEGRQTYNQNAQGRQIVFHYTAYDTPYFYIFPRRSP